LSLAAPQDTGKTSVAIRFHFTAASTGEDLGYYNISSTLYTTIGFSKELSNERKPPMASMIDLAMQYNAGAKSEPLSTANIINGIFNDKLHKYRPNVPTYAQSNDACDSGGEILLYSYYIFKKQVATEASPLILDCVASSALAATLLRSIGVSSDLFGFQKSGVLIDTNVIYTYGNRHKNGRPLWIRWKDFNFHQLNSMQMCFGSAEKGQSPNRVCVEGGPSTASVSALRAGVLGGIRGLSPVSLRGGRNRGGEGRPSSPGSPLDEPHRTIP
jgi:hypothetical protein